MPVSQTVAIEPSAQRTPQGKNIVFQPVGICSVKIDVNAIPEYQRGQLAEFALELTRNTFSRPGEEERYQAWLAKRNAAKAAMQGGGCYE